MGPKFPQTRAIEHLVSDFNGLITPAGLLVARLFPKYAGNTLLPMRDLHVSEYDRGKWVVFFVYGGQYHVVEDDDMFPSDSLVTRIRLVIS